MRILFVIITICFNLNLTAQNIIGAWSGNLDIQGQQMELLFHFEKEDNEYIGTFDIPSQGAIGIPIEKIEISQKKQLSLSLMGGNNYL